jgi:hypothetical protein
MRILTKKDFSPVTVVDEIKDIVPWTDVPLIEFARQICLFESDLLQRLEYSEFTGMAWIQSHNQAPNLLKLIRRFNFVICKFDCI